VVLDVADDGAFEDPTERQDVTDGEHGTVAAVDELAHVHAPGVANGERGVAAVVVLVVKLGRDCNLIILWGSPRVNSFLYL